VDSGLPRGLLPIYVAHEFNHVLQFATDFTEPYLPMWEATASAAELWTYPDDDLDRGPIRDFQAEPWLGILGDGYMVPDNNWSLYEYGAVVWILHLDNTWGDGLGSTGPALWAAAEQDGWTNEPDMIDAYDSLTGGWHEALMDLHVQRARLGTDDPPDWGADWTQSGFAVAVVDEVEASDLPVSLSPEQGPIQTGVVYVAITNATPGEPFTLSIDGATTVDWGLLVVDGADSTWEVGRELTWTANTGTLIFGAVNLAEDGWDADRSLRQAEPVLNVWGIDGPGDDGGDGGDDGGSTDGDGDGGDDGVGGNTDGEDKGGCSTTGGAPVGWAVAPLLLLGLIRRRRSA
jgi:uncharacterized protein (TIGR03382 family)